MKIFVLVNPGLEQLAQQEIEELISVQAKVYSSVLELEVKNKEEILSLAYHLQSVRRVLVSLEAFSELDDLEFRENFPWQDYFSSDLTFKVDVENVKGNENRLAIAKKVAGKVFSRLEKKGVKSKLELKEPDLLVNAYFNGKKYFVGVDFCGQELNSRHYRLFTSPASFKGDLAYFFVRQVGFKPREKLLAGFVKDGTVAIEAALFANGLPVLSKKVKQYSFSKFPLFKDFGFSEFLIGKKEATIKISAFDPNRQNIIAARKNSQLAGTKEYLDLQKYPLDELDVKFSQGEFDRLIFQVTSKDEDKLNEIYYQASYVLRKKGTFLLFGRKNWEISVSSKFKLLQEEELVKGESGYKIWLLEKK